MLLLLCYCVSLIITQYTMAKNVGPDLSARHVLPINQALRLIEDLPSMVMVVVTMMMAGKAISPWTTHHAPSAWSPEASLKRTPGDYSTVRVTGILPRVALE